MKLESSKEDIKTERSTTKQGVNKDQVNWKAENMDSEFMYSTPQISRDGQGSAITTVHSTYSIDSGISETFNSTWTSSIHDISSVSTECSPDEQTDNRSTLKAYEYSPIKATGYSPIKRVSSTCIQARRLSFTESDFEETGGLSGVSVEHCEKFVTCQHESTPAVEQTPTTQLLCNHRDQSHCGSPDSACDDDLEVSLQEMLLDETPAQLSTPDLSSVPWHWARQHCCVQGNITQAFQRQSQILPTCTFCHHVPDSCTEKSEKESLSSNLPWCWTLRQPSSLSCVSTEAFYSSIDAKLKFLNKLSLTPANTDRCQTLEHAAVVSKQDRLRPAHSQCLHAACEFCPGRVISTHNSFLHRLAQLPVPALSIQDRSSLQNNVSQLNNCDSIVDNCDSPEDLNNKSSTQNLYTSKRLSDCTEDSSFLFSPTKVRRKDTSIEEDKVTISSLRKCALRQGFLVDSIDDSVLDCGKLKEDELHVVTSTKLHSFIPRTIEETKSTCDFEKEKPAIVWPQTWHGSKTVEAGVESVQHDYCLTDEAVKSCIQRMMREMCPHEPSHTIGRHVGIGRLDIVHQLYSQYFHLCLESIFQHLSDGDLTSVAGVSTTWKQALQNDRKAYNRYRQCKKSRCRSNIQRGSGKENSGKKATETTTARPLTQSRGLLSFMQSQAQTKALPEPPTAIMAKESLMCDDTLRVCPRCQSSAMVKPCQDRATCMRTNCLFDFCTLCFSTFHHPRPCKPLCKVPSTGDVAGTKRSKKNLKRL